MINIMPLNIAINDYSESSSPFKPCALSNPIILIRRFNCKCGHSNYLPACVNNWTSAIPRNKLCVKLYNIFSNTNNLSHLQSQDASPIAIPNNCYSRTHLWSFRINLQCIWVIPLSQLTSHKIQSFCDF